MLNFVRQYEAEAYLVKKGYRYVCKVFASWLRTYPNFAFFFPRLVVEYYAKIGEHPRRHWKLRIVH